MWFEGYGNPAISASQAVRLMWFVGAQLVLKHKKCILLNKGSNSASSINLSIFIIPFSVVFPILPERSFKDV